MEIKQFFREQFGYTPTHVIQAPGRLELIGNHTDYNQGLVLALAVDRSVLMGCSPRPDGKIQLASSAFPKKEIFNASAFSKNPDATWADYIKGVLEQLRKRGVPFRGFDLGIHSTIPMGAGMSSSAALEVATALAVKAMFPYALTPTGSRPLPPRSKDEAAPPLTATERLEIAKACQAAENQYVGVNSGLLDQISSLFGKAFHAIEIDCQSLAVGYVPMVGEISIVVCNSGKKHELVGGEYNELREHCESAARTLGVKALRAVEPRMLEAAKSKLSKREYECAYHIVGEIHRVIFGARALLENDFEQFGQYMLQSHQSSREFFGNSTPELDLLVDLAREHPACLGARLTGGGFGGATINLVRRPLVDKFRKDMAAHYGAKTGITIDPLVCAVVDGAKQL